MTVNLYSAPLRRQGWVTVKTKSDLRKSGQHRRSDRVIKKVWN